MGQIKKLNTLSEPVLPKAKLWSQADRVSLETAVPPVFGKESAHAGIKGMSSTSLKRCFLIAL